MNGKEGQHKKKKGDNKQTQNALWQQTGGRSTEEQTIYKYHENEWNNGKVKRAMT